MIPQAIAIANGKGGVGKTSIGANVAGMAALSGWRTLLVDLDPQSNLSDELGVLNHPAYDDGQSLLFAVLGGNPPTVINDVRPKLDLISGGRHTKQLRDQFTLNPEPENLLALRNTLATLATDYDLVIIDTPPATDRLVHAAFAATHYLVLPSRGDQASVRGLVHTSDVFADVVDTINPHLRVLGIVRFGFNPRHTTRLRNANARIQGVLDGLPIPVFDTFIRTADKASEDVRDRGLLVHEYAQESANAPAFYEALRNGTTPAHYGSNADDLATDYLNLWNEIRTRYTNDLENPT